ncbi:MULTISPECIES: PQQ-binding-like beta-propeller repeat protein [unclassified Novosphingobium]|uniref:outer membrane protein assembly factor BamB family protein n=1 Tax=unclassified Novosphingobium TaxID=2644732 RepID=UPI00135BCE50|nr:MULTISPECIES: PQQ-binding-like beta-propeller repeat protein [unclassified Novosphingobium]
MRKVVSVFTCVVLSSCGGESDDSTPVAPVPVVPTLAVTLAPSASSQAATEENSVASFTLDATYSGSSTDAIVPVLSFDAALLSLDGSVVQSGNKFTANFKTVSGLSAAVHKATVAFKLCKEAGCATVYPGSTQSFDYTLDVKFSDWTTRQRNPSHNGYVHATFDPAKIVKVWQYAPSATQGFREVAAKAGTIYSTRIASDGSSVAVALDASSGAERWHYSLGNVSNASGPALSDGEVLFSTMFTSSGNNPLVVLDAASGQFKRNLIFAAQWSTFAQPTVYDDSAYIASGYYGNEVYAWNFKAGTQTWQTSGSGGNSWDGEAPAVDARYLYYYSGNLDVIDRVTGAIVKSIDDPFWQWNGYSYGGTPMIGSDNHVVAYSGNGQGTYSISFPLVSYDIAKGAYRWRTASGYTVIPAVGKGVVYAASNQVLEFDAIDEETGAVKWAWPLPAGEKFTGNIVVTDTLAFVSTDAGVYAIDLTSHATAWSARTPGLLAITPDAQLVVSSPSSGMIIAYSLR